MTTREMFDRQRERRRLKKKLIICVLGDKGGVGKSLIARAHAAWLRRLGYVVVGSDGDMRNAHLQRFYGDSMQVMRHSLRSAEGWSDMYGSWEAADDADVILVDTPGNIGDMLEQEAARFLQIAAALHREIIILWVADEGEDSVALLRFCAGLAPQSRTLFVMNGRFGDASRDFQIWNNSKTRATFIVAGGHEAYFPRLPSARLKKLNDARCPFDDLSAAALTIIETVDFNIWWSQVETAFRPVAEMLDTAS